MPDDVLAAKKFLAYYGAIKEAVLATTGKPLKEYQPTDPARLEEAFRIILESPLTGKEFIGQLAHELIWRQCLGNANHRTTFLFVQAFLVDVGVEFPHYASSSDDTRYRNELSAFTDRSKDSLDRQNEWGYGPKEFERRHRGHTAQLMDSLLGPQSFDWAMIGAQRLMVFISRSEISG